MSASGFTPAGVGGDLRRQELDGPHDERRRRVLHELVDRARDDAALTDLLNEAWNLGWAAGFNDANSSPDVPLMASPFSRSGGWL